MAAFATTKMSSKGQVVIPENVREKLALKSGVQFIVLGEKDTIVLKTIVPPRMEDFDRLIAEARKQAKASGLKRRDIQSAIQRARGHREGRS